MYSLLLILCAAVRAQEADDVDVELGEVDEEIPQQQQQPQVVYRRPSHPLTDLAPPHPDVETAYAFVKHADNSTPNPRSCVQSSPSDRLANW